MSFKEFWPLYMRAHRLPGTRALHYFATAIGILSAIEAVVAHKPYVFLFGIAISYGIAIFAHSSLSSNWRMDCRACRMWSGGWIIANAWIWKSRRWSRMA